MGNFANIFSKKGEVFLIRIERFMSDDLRLIYTPFFSFLLFNLFADIYRISHQRRRWYQLLRRTFNVNRFIVFCVRDRGGMGREEAACEARSAAG